MIRQLNKLFKIDKCETIPWQTDHSTTLSLCQRKHSSSLPRAITARMYLHCRGLLFWGMKFITSTRDLKSSDHVSYGGPPPMHRSIYRSIQRSLLDRVQVDMSVDYRPMYRPILLSVDILGGSPIFHQYLTDTSPILHRYCTDASPILQFIHWSTLHRDSSGR